MRIEVNQLPPVSSSSNWRGHWAERYKGARIYHNAVFYSCVDARNRALVEGKPYLFNKARLKVTFVFPQHRRRDRDNLLARFKPDTSPSSEGCQVLPQHLGGEWVGETRSLAKGLVMQFKAKTMAEAVAG